jgi:hypothetical protein
MELITWIPLKVFYLFIVGGIAAAAILYHIPLVPHKNLFIVGTILVAVFGVYAVGIIHNNQRWQARVDELQAKVVAAEAKSQQVNEVIKERVVFKTQLIKQRGENTVEYITREVTKHDNTCVIPKEFIKAHNRAAELPK